MAEQSGGAAWALAMLPQSSASKETQVGKGHAETAELTGTSTAETQALQVRAYRDSATATWRMQERTEQGDSCYAELLFGVVLEQRGCGLGDLGDLGKMGLSSDCGLGGLIWVIWVVWVV